MYEAHATCMVTVLVFGSFQFLANWLFVKNTSNQNVIQPGPAVADAIRQIINAERNISSIVLLVYFWFTLENETVENEKENYNGRNGNFVHLSLK